MTDLTQSDAILGGRVRLLQSARGYRAGMDAALLAAACDAQPGERVLDLGCGPGAVMLAAAVRRPGAHFTGIEADPDALDLARANIDLNGLADRVEGLAGDVALPFSRLGLPRFDAALCNPPFFDDASALRGPAPEKSRAWMATDGLAAWTGYLLKAVRDGGTITLIHRADRLADLVYWAGLGIIGIIAFGVIGAAIGVAIRDSNIFLGILLALGILGIGMLGVGVGVLLWRAFCEFYVTIFKISEDLHVLRQDVEAERAKQGHRP